MNHSAKKPVVLEAKRSQQWQVKLIHVHSLSRCVGYLFLYLFSLSQGRIKNMLVVAKLAMTMALPLHAQAFFGLKCVIFPKLHFTCASLFDHKH